MTVERWADRRKYTNEFYGHGYISGWGQYFTAQPTEDFDIVHDDIDLHRDSGEPALQLCRGEVRFKRAVTLSDKQPLNLMLGQLGWRVMMNGCYTARGKLPAPGRVDGKLGRGNYVTWPGAWSVGTIFALDEDFAVQFAVTKKDEQYGRPAYGYALGARTFKPGDVLKYRLLIMRWPMGLKPEDRLDAKVGAALNLARPDSGARIAATRGKVVGTQVYLDLEARDAAFRGTLARKDFGLRIPVRLAGLEPNWTAAVWHAGMKLLMPITPDPDGYAWTSLDPLADAGDLFIGNVLTCENPAVILRLLQRSDGAWTLLAHNPTDQPVTITVKGADGGPVAGASKKLGLKRGEEVTWIVRR